MDEYERYTGPGNQWRILLHDSQEENDRLWCMYESLRLKYEEGLRSRVSGSLYDELLQELCASEDSAYELEGERDEAREIAGELFAALRENGHDAQCWKNTSRSWLGVGGRLASCTCGLERIRPGVRKALER